MPKLRKDGKPNLQNSSMRYSNATAMAMNLCRMGKPKAEVVEALVNTFGYTANVASNMYHKASAELREKYDKYKDKIADENIKRVEAIIDESYNTGDMTNALKGVDILNKMGNVYVNKVDVNANLNTFEIKVNKD